MTALGIGATGLVGSALLELLQQDSRFDRIIVFTRRELPGDQLKTEQHVVDFEHLQSWAHLVKGDVLFSTLGTTLKVAGSKEAQYRVDYTYQFEVAKAASDNGVRNYVLVSAAFASPQSRIFYSRMKGELERDVKNLRFESIHILRPGMLQGNRKEERLGEKIGIRLLTLAHHLPGLGSLKPIDASIVAKAMINASMRRAKKINVYSLSEVFQLAKPAS